MSIFTDSFKKAFTKAAETKSSTKTPSFGASLRGSAFAKPSKTITTSTPNYGISKGNAKSGYKSGSTAGVSTNSY